MQLEIRKVGEGTTDPDVGFHDIPEGYPTATLSAYGTETSQFMYWLVDDEIELDWWRITIQMDRPRLAVAYFTEIEPPPNEVSREWVVASAIALCVATGLIYFGTKK